MEHPHGDLRPSGVSGPLNGPADAAAVGAPSPPPNQQQASKKKPRRGADPASQKRRCVSTACIACRKRKSKCDGALPSCAACASVYGTECVYDPNSDHRRKGVYREKIDSMKARTSTLQILIEAILNASDDEVPDVVARIRNCDSLDTVAEQILKQEETANGGQEANDTDSEYTTNLPLEGERELASKMGELRLENGSVRFIGGTSHLLYMGDSLEADTNEPELQGPAPHGDPLLSWTEATKDRDLIIHLINMYFSWHYTYFATLSKTLFYRDFLKGRWAMPATGTVYCSSLLVNAMLALGCHFTSVEGAFAIPGDSGTKGDHFFAEAKRLIIENDVYEKPRLTTVQALALLSVREAGCGREAKGWVYSGMSFRMAQDMGLNFDDGGQHPNREGMDEHAVDARRITLWGCFLFDKCWSNYLGRLPQIPRNSYNVPKYDVFPSEDAEPWKPCTDNGFEEQPVSQPARTRAIGLQLLKLCEISSDLLLFFYHPNHIGRSSGKSVELKKLSELHRRLEDWRKELPGEFEPKDGQLPNVILVHMFFHLQYIHLFRPFLKYQPSASPLPSHVSPRRICTANAGAISKLMRLYKKTWNLRQICNIAVYMVHSACTIHMLNLPEKTARRDITHGVKHLEEIAEDWPCARRTLSIISVLGRKWKVELPEEAAAILQRADERFGSFNTSDVPSPRSHASHAVPSPTGSIEQTTAGGGGGAGGGRAAASFAGGTMEQYSPLNQFVHTQMPAELAGGPPDVPIENSLTMAMQQTPLHSMRGSISGADGRPPSWLASHHGAVNTHPQPLPTPTPGFPSQRQHQPQPQQPHHQHSQPQPQLHSQAQPPYTPMSNLTPQSHSVPGTRQVTPGSQVFHPLDDEWLLTDGAKWHQNFDAWGLGPVMAEEPGEAQAERQRQRQDMFMFPSPAGGGGTGDLSSGADAPQRYGSEERVGSSGFDALNSLSNDSGWLPPHLD